MNLLRVSRPRFWPYLFGPYILGAATFVAQNSNPAALLLLLIYGCYFLLPANLLIYGVNDIFDYETDILNQKKNSYESVLPPDQRRETLTWIISLNLPFVLMAPFLLPPTAVFGLAAFLFFGIGYSAPPIRAKTKPFLDSLFNILYIFPAVVSFGFIGLPPVTLLLAGACWCMAMHAFSAVPDIEADTKAKLETIATVLGQKNTILLCLFLYLLSAVLSFPLVGQLTILLGIVYVTLMVVALNKTGTRLHEIYKLFPVINILSGLLLTLRILLTMITR